jgi:hypothetical protein
MGGIPSPDTLGGPGENKWLREYEQTTGNFSKMKMPLP